MGILDGIVEWIAEQVMAGLDLVTTSLSEIAAKAGWQSRQERIATVKAANKNFLSFFKDKTSL